MQDFFKLSQETKMHRRKIFEKRIETIKEIVPNVLSFLSAEKNYNMSAKLYLTVIQNS